MAVEVSLNTIGSGYNRALINENFVEIESALEDALSRSGTSPNTMGVDLDMDSNDLLNVGTLNTAQLILGGIELAASDVQAVGPQGEAATVTVGDVTTGAAGTDVIVTNVGDEVNAVFDITIPRGDTGASGAGSGDMVAAQNLSDVVDAATSFDNIKQTATDTYEGVLELSVLAELFPNYLSGLTISNNTTDSTNDIDIAIGVATDSTNSRTIKLTSGLTKRLDASWSVGNNQGMRDTGSISNATWHIFLIMRPDTGVVDVLASLSPTAPTLPANYTYFRRISSIVRASGTIKPFVQYGDNFIWGVQVADIAATNPGTSAVTAVLTVPTGIVVNAQIMLSIIDITPADTGHYALLTPLVAANTAPSASAFSLDWGLNGGVVGGADSVVMSVLTNTSASVRYRLSISNSAITVRLQTIGWIDTRGR